MGTLWPSSIILHSYVKVNVNHHHYKDKSGDTVPDNMSFPTAIGKLTIHHTANLPKPSNFCCNGCAFGSFCPTYDSASFCKIFAKCVHIKFDMGKLDREQTTVSWNMSNSTLLEVFVIVSLCLSTILRSSALSFIKFGALRPDMLFDFMYSTSQEMR